MSFPPRSIPPGGRPEDYVTYAIRKPRDTGIVATCKDVGCDAWKKGWQLAYDESKNCGGDPDKPCAWLAGSPVPCGACAARYVRYRLGRTFREQRTGTGLTVFRFEPGERCLVDHGTRPDVLLRRDGDYRGNPTGLVVRHTRPEDWIEDFQEHEGALADLRAKG